MPLRTTKPAWTGRVRVLLKGAVGMTNQEYRKIPCSARTYTVTPADRINSALRKAAVLAGRCDVSSYLNQITTALAYMRVNHQ